MMVDGGVIAISGFRYQMLRALEEILKLHQEAPGGDWAVEVEHATNDKVDYAVHRFGKLTRAVQVKASLPGSSTKLSLHGEKGVAGILSNLAESFPAAPEVVLISNRKGPWAAIGQWVLERNNNGGPRVRAVQEDRTLQDVEESVSRMMREVRMLGQLPSDRATTGALVAILEAKLWRLGSQELGVTPEGRRMLDSAEVLSLLGMRDQQLASVLGELTWVMKWKGPAARAIARPAIFSFLAYALPPSPLSRGEVRRAALTGFGGLGKSMSVAGWAADHQGLYTNVIWMNSSASETMEADARQILEAEYGADVASWTRNELKHRFRDRLQKMVQSWLLVLDDAASVQIVDEWIPANGFGHVIITTRDSAWPSSHAPTFEVGRLNQTEIESLVELRLGVPELSRAELDLMEQVTDRWALAVDMVLAWISRNQHTLADLANFDPRASRQLLLDEPGLVPTGYPTPVVVIILDALSSLQAENPKAWSLFQAVVALGSNNVPVPLASGYAEDSLEDILERDRLVADLRSRSVASPMSLGDPRLGMWGYRISVHDLISQQVDLLDPVDIEEWAVLLERLALLVGDSADKQNLALALSLRTVVDSVDEAVSSGKPFTIEYLTLLGNMAVILAAAGHLAEAAERLERERLLARAQSHVLSGTSRRRVEWFGLQATLQLASVRYRLEDAGGALALLEEAVPNISAFHGKVDPDKLSKSLEQAIDVLEAIRTPELLPAKEALLSVARGGPVQESASALRRAEALLRDGDLLTARTLCENALESNPTLIERVDFFGKLAESWAVEDVEKSDDLLLLAHRTAEFEGVDPSQVVDDVLGVLRLRMIHLLGLDAETRRRDLNIYRPWFGIGRLVPAAEQCRNTRQAFLSRLTSAWRELALGSEVASELVLEAAGAFEKIPQSVSPDERLGLQSLLWGTQFTDACLPLDRIEAVGNIGRLGSRIIIELSEETWNCFPELVARSVVTGRPLVVGSRFGPLVLIEVAGRGFALEVLEFDPFSNVAGRVTICVAGPGAFDEGSRRVEAGSVIEVGEIQGMHAMSDYLAVYRDSVSENSGQ